MKVEIVYGQPDQQTLLQLEIKHGATIYEALLQSNILNLIPNINLEQQSVGVFGKVRPLSDILSEGDRIEIYRPLIIDPKDARRIRAEAARRRVG